MRDSLPVFVKTAEPWGGVISGVAQGGSTQLRSSHEVKVYVTSLPQHPGGRHRLIRWLSNSPANKHGSGKTTKLRAFLKPAEDFQRHHWYVGSSVFVGEFVWFTLLPPDANCDVEGLKQASTLESDDITCYFISVFKCHICWGGWSIIFLYTQRISLIYLNLD